MWEAEVEGKRPTNKEAKQAAGKTQHISCAEPVMSIVMSSLAPSPGQGGCPRGGCPVVLPSPQSHLMEPVSFLGLLLPASLSSNPVFLSPSNLPVIILWALGKKTCGQVTCSVHSALLTELHRLIYHHGQHPLRPPSGLPLALVKGHPIRAGALLYVNLHTHPEK